MAGLKVSSIQRFLLYYTGAVASLNGRYGQGSGPVFYADIMCGGLEGRLADCDKGEIEETNCGHNQDAGVQCLPGKCDWCLQF